MEPRDLPVYQQRDRILAALEGNQVIVVESPTGSGKTTQLPIILHEAGYSRNGLIGVTQPRRIAALSVSDFIARQLGTKVPGVVGYKMRFEDKTNDDTVIKIMTDGILLQEMKLDPALSRYGAIMVDEAHERSLNIDFILGLLKRVIEARPEFKVIVSSATINAEVFSEYFGECPIVKIETTMFPVTLVYDPPAAAGEQPAYGSGEIEALQAKVEQIVSRIVSERREGDILIFMPGEKTIKDCAKRLAFGPVGGRLHVIPLYARLGKDEQERVFEKAPLFKTKVVIATNIAETSVTIDGITSVIDSGLAKLNFYNPRTFTSSLIETPISKASCNQRKGRAGRTRPGSCYRLYARSDFENRPLFTTEEIYRTDLTEVVLRMAELGITEFERFDFISQPAKSGIAGAVDALALLDALNADRSLTKVGEMMCAFPLLPRHSRMIAEAILAYPDVVEEVLVAASFLSTMSPYILPPGEEMEARRAHHAFRDPAGDFVSYLKILKSFMEARDQGRWCERNYLDERTMLEIARIKEQLELIVSGMGVPIAGGGSIDDYLCAVSRGLIQFVCARQERGMFRSLTAEKIQIHPGSVMYRENPPFIVAGEVVRTTRMYAMSVSPLDRRLLSRISPRLAALGASAGGGREEEGSDRRTGRRAFDAVSGGASLGAGSHVGSRASSRASARASARDFTNKIKIGSEVFDIVPGKGKRKMAVLDWPTLRKAREGIDRDSLGMFGGMTGVVTAEGRKLMEGEKLEVILRIASWLDIEGDLGKEWPRKRNFDAGEGLDELVDALDHVLQVARAKDKSAELGFVALFTDGEGMYWFRCSRGFHTALNESLAALEALADALGETATHAQREKVSALYRKLSGFFE
ncbi:MAG: ATP-dependent RNA helicase [Spirochaetaceae bacterium]|nr:ATP-dependent RNA helicase [Spirochaetaceae bacterium]